MKRSILLALLLVIVFMAFGCSKPADTYFPYTEGMYREYQKFETGMFGMQNSSKLMITNLKERELNGKKVFPLKYEEEIASVGKRTWFIFVSEEKDGLTVFANQPVNTVEPIILNPPRYFIKFPLTAGTEWEEESKTYSLQKIVPIMIRKSIVSTDETVTVPSGTYNKCLKIKGIGHATIDMGFLGNVPVDKEVYDWYAPNIGWIKGFVKENSNNLLVGTKTTSYQLEAFKKK